MSEEFDRRDWAEDLNAGIRNRDTWFRGLKIVVLLFFLAIARFALLVTVLYQFCFSLVRNRPSELVLPVGPWLARYVEKAILYLTWNSDHAPFPFASIGSVMKQGPDYPNEESTLEQDEESLANEEQRYDSEPPTPPATEDNTPDQEDTIPDEEDNIPDEETAAEEDGEEPQEDQDESSPPPRPDA